MKNFFIILTVLLFMGVASSLRFPRNPDQMRWAVLNCLHVQQPTDELYKKWTNFELPDDGKTHCFVKCILKNSRIYPLHLGRVNKTALEYQFKSHGMEVPKGVENLGNVIAGSCTDIYNEVKDVFLNNVEAFKKAFYFYDDDVKKWFKENTGVARPFGANMREYCDKKYKDNSECLVYCRFYYYRLVDEDKKVFWGWIHDTPGIPLDKRAKCLRKASKEKHCQVPITLQQYRNSSKDVAFRIQ
uniref:D7-related protein n=1 Tax=Sergentomyia schwetzi TaxID=114605 RepID=A0A6B9VMV9_9DIPT|nr:D7-related protein [Sergentomyia schwetzi]